MFHHLLESVVSHFHFLFFSNLSHTVRMLLVIILLFKITTTNDVCLILLRAPESPATFHWRGRFLILCLFLGGFVSHFYFFKYICNRCR
jgi:hypothetical protein